MTQMGTMISSKFPETKIENKNSTQCIKHQETLNKKNTYSVIYYAGVVSLVFWFSDDFLLLLS